MDQKLYYLPTSLSEPSLKDLVFGQDKINDGFHKKLAACDTTLESLNTMIDSLSYALKS
jgi:hypothetical protein